MQMEMILAKPIEELTPALIAFNNEEMLKNLNQALEKYKGKTYTTETISEAKEDRAKLNALTSKIDDVRKEVGRVYEAPYKEFKAKVDEIINVIKEVSTTIDAQVKEYEQQRREEKRQVITDYFNSVLYDLKDLIPIEKIFNEKWLNATVKIPAIQKEIDAILSQVRNDLMAINSLENKKDLLVYYFRTLSLSATIAENERIKAEKSKVEQLTIKTENTPCTPKQTAQSSQRETIYEVNFKVTANIEQLRALKKFLMENDIKYSKIKE